MSKNKLQIISLFLLLSTILAGVVSNVIAGAENRYEAPLRVHMSQDPTTPEVAGSKATLVTNRNGATFLIDTTLSPGHAATVWWAVVNNPTACASSPCTAGDILGNTAAVQANVLYGTGSVIGASGRVKFHSHLPKGAINTGWYSGLDHDFGNPEGAEIHLIINDHGPALPEFMPDMITTYRGGCQDAGLPPFPETALSDGTPGPNTCRLMQFVIFMQ